MLTVEEVRSALQDRNLKAVSRKTDLSYATIWKVANDKDSQVSYDTIKKLSDYLEGKRVRKK